MDKKTSREAPDGKRQDQFETGWGGAIFGLGTAISWAISPVFIRKGLEEFTSPILAVTLGTALATVAYGVMLLFRKRTYSKVTIPPGVWLNQGLAGVLNGLGTLFRWIALDLAPVGVVVTLARLNMVVVIVISTLTKGTYAESLTWRGWLGAALILAGAVILGLS